MGLAPPLRRLKVELATQVEEARLKVGDGEKGMVKGGDLREAAIGFQKVSKIIKTLTNATEV